MEKLIAHNTRDCGCLQTFFLRFKKLGREPIANQCRETHNERAGLGDQVFAIVLGTRRIRALPRGSTRRGSFSAYASNYLESAKRPRARPMAARLIETHHHPPNCGWKTHRMRKIQALSASCR